VSANAAKSGKSVSPKVRQKGDRVCANPENAAGGFFQHPLSYSVVQNLGSIIELSLAEHVTWSNIPEKEKAEILREKAI